MVALLRSPRFALAVLALAALYCGAGAWLPWALPDAGPPPAWAVRAGLDHPFTAWPFLASIVLLFASTLACTWGRRARLAAALRGELPASAAALAGGGRDARAFLAAQGYRGDGDVLVRNGWALWGGWILHVGLLVLMAAAAFEQASSDGGAFDLSEGETASLREPGAVFARDRGPLAPAEPPDLTVTLERFDPFLHQAGYQPDRASRLAVASSGTSMRIDALDRAAGARVGDVDLYQAVPTGLAVIVEIEGLGHRAVHLQREGPLRGAASLLDPAGRPARLVAETERGLDDRLGTGRLSVWLEQDGARVTVAPGVPFAFGTRPATLVAVRRWGRFTWSRTPGLWAVWIGFLLVLGGAGLLSVPCGVARLAEPGGAVAARVFLPWGRQVLLAEWRAGGPP